MLAEGGSGSRARGECIRLGRRHAPTYVADKVMGGAHGSRYDQLVVVAGGGDQHIVGEYAGDRITGPNAQDPRSHQAG